VNPGAAFLAASSPPRSLPPGAADAAPAEAAIVAGTNATASTIASFFLGTSCAFLLGSYTMPYAHDDGPGGVRFPPTQVERFAGVGAAWEPGRANFREPPKAEVPRITLPRTRVNRRPGRVDNGRWWAYIED